MNDILHARNASLAEDIIPMLMAQRVRRLDLVVSPDAITAQGGNIVVANTPGTQWVDDEGITQGGGSYRPTVVGDETLGQKLGIPVDYLKKLRDQRPDMWDDNVNGMLHGLQSEDVWGDGDTETIYPGYDGNLMLRLLRPDKDADDGDDGVLRAVLSSRYRIIDNLDVALSVMKGITKAGVNALPTRCDLTDRKMYLRFACPEIAAFAPNLLDGYRTPFKEGGAARANGDNGMGMILRPGGHWTVPQALEAARREGLAIPAGEEKIVFAGFVVSNSDVGGGARTITPEIEVEVCGNRLTLTFVADRKIHLGTDKQEGVIEWSDETLQKELELIAKQTEDAVVQYTSQEFLNENVAKIEALAGKTVKEPETVIKEVSKLIGFNQSEADEILKHFYMGGNMKAGGVAQAITSVSQTLGNADRAYEMDAKAFRAMELVAARAA